MQTAFSLPTPQKVAQVMQARVTVDTLVVHSTENLLPEQSGGTISSTYKTELGALFQFLKYNNTQ